jgi:hypothetical protein
MKITATAIALALTLASSLASAQGKQTQTKGKQPAPAAKAPAAASAPANPPQITAIGLRVIGLGLGANGTELRPFQEAPGTTIALGVTAPKGAGLVDIDDRGSKLDTITDDKGQSLMEEARVGSFPKISEDGSAAIVELEVRARPSAGASSITAQGTLAMTLAGGSKPFRASNVKLDNGQTFKIGPTTITLSDVKADDESMRFTVNLPRSLYTTIREIRFFDAKGATVEMARHSSGYFNEKAEIELEAKTKDKTLAIELEVWQNLKTSKFPFSVQAGLGLAAGAPGGTGTGAGSRAVSTDAVPDKPSAADAAPKKPAGPPPAISPGEGAESVEAVVKQMQTAAAAAKGAQVMSVIYPTDRGEYAQGVAVSLAFLPMAAMDDQKVADSMTKELDAFFAKHNVKPPFNKDPSELFKGVDTSQFVADAFVFIKAHAKKGDNATDMMPVPSGKPENVKVTGDTATASLNGKDVNFAKISGRWFIRLN